MNEEVWTEVLNEAVSVVWAWDGYSLGCVVIEHDGYHVEPATKEAIGQYADDKEVDLTVYEMYDDADFDGSVEEFTQEVVGIA